jgi:hypothetical protein
VSKQERDRRYNVQRQWQHLYNDPRWHAIRAKQLAEHPLCERHEKRGELIEATVAHHVEVHKGDPALFFRGPFESLCKRCHDGEAQQEEKRGYASRVGADGWPVDKRHPVNNKGEGYITDVDK